MIIIQLPAIQDIAENQMVGSIQNDNSKNFKPFQINNFN